MRRSAILALTLPIKNALFVLNSAADCRSFVRFSFVASEEILATGDACGCHPKWRLSRVHEHRRHAGGGRKANYLI